MVITLDDEACNVWSHEDCSLLILRHILSNLFFNFFFQIETGCVYVAEKKDSKTMLAHAIVFIFIENRSLVWKRIFELRSWPRTGIIPEKTKKTNCCKLLTSYLASLHNTLVYPPKNVFSNFDYDSGTCFITLLVKFSSFFSCWTVPQPSTDKGSRCNDRFSPQR